MKERKAFMKKIFLSLLVLLSLFLLVLGGYVIYLFTSYYRLPDKQVLKFEEKSEQILKTKTTYTATTFNIGFGAYSRDFSFFMDHGKYSRGYNKKEVFKNMAGIVATIEKEKPDISFFQEVDVAGQRSQQVNQVAFLKKNFADYNAVFAQNYDSPYLFYPFTKPIGKAKSGLVTLSSGKILASTRYRLPIETNLNKFTDLDRAFSLTQVAVENNHILTLINTHLSAFTSEPTVHDEQLKKLFSLMEEEYQKGHYVIVAGDYNHDLLGDSPEVFHTEKERKTWTEPFPKDSLPKGFSIPIGNLKTAKIPSVRASNIPYDPQKSYVSLVDGFIISDNISVEELKVVNGDFENSDHNPVKLSFSLN